MVVEPEDDLRRAAVHDFDYAATVESVRLAQLSPAVHQITLYTRDGPLYDIERAPNDTWRSFAANSMTNRVTRISVPCPFVAAMNMPLHILPSVIQRAIHRRRRRGHRGGAEA